jgi:hypothetical protein
MLHTLRFSLQNAVYFIMLTFFFFLFFMSVHHRTIEINHQHDATVFQFIMLTFVYSSTCSGHFPPIIRSLVTAVAASAFTFVSW